MDQRGLRLKTALAYRNVRKLYALASDLGVDISAVSKWAAGGPMSLGRAVQLCATLDISLDWLLLGRGHIEAHKSVAVRPEEIRALAALQRLDPGALRSLADYLDAPTPPDGG